MPGVDIESFKRRIGAVASAQPQVLLVYLFGSQVTGEVGPESDVDLAALLGPGAPAARIRLQLALSFAAALDGASVDVVILNRAPVELAFSVIAQGVVLYQRDAGERVEYEAGVLSRYGDYLPFLRKLRQDILEGAGDERRVQRYREALGRTERALGTSGSPARQATN